MEVTILAVRRETMRNWILGENSVQDEVRFYQLQRGQSITSQVPSVLMLRTLCCYIPNIQDPFQQHNTPLFAIPKP